MKMNPLDRKVITFFEGIVGRKNANAIMIVLGVLMILVSIAVLLVLCSLGVLAVMHQHTVHGIVIFMGVILMCAIISRVMLNGSVIQLREYWLRFRS